jgi:hypothetical protein
MTVLLVLALVAAACGVESGALGGAQTPDDDTGVVAPGNGSVSPGDHDISWSRVEGRFDLVDGRIGYVHDVVVDPDDDRVILVRFFGGVEECYGANATLISHTADEIVVQLEVGSVPHGDETGACIDIAMAQEIALHLDRPAGDAELRAVSPDAAAAFVGLARDEAIAAAEADDRSWRIAREDGEEFVLTMDYRPDRINFEIDAGVVTSAWMG